MNDENSIEDESNLDPYSAAGVQSVEVGMSILRPLVSAGRPIPLKMITSATGMPRAKVHRYLVSLVRSGLVWQEPGTGYYGIGSFAVQLGLSALGLLDRDALGRQAIRELRDKLNITACMCVWAMGPIVIAVEPAETDLFVGLRTGSRLSMTNSATGRIFLSYLPTKTWRAHVAQESMQDFDLDDVRESTLLSGVAGVKDLVMPGMSGVAAPVFDHTGSITATLTLVGPTHSFDHSSQGDVARTLCDKAQCLSIRLGYLPSKRSNG
jgi:DNA-binding IclR family transcriptional regulator